MHKGHFPNNDLQIKKKCILMRFFNRTEELVQKQTVFFFFQVDHHFTIAPILVFSLVDFPAQNIADGIYSVHPIYCFYIICIASCIARAALVFFFFF